MFLYVQKRIDSAHAGTRFIGVDCEKCGCRYFYRLARIGTGRGVAPYGIGASAAKTAAEEQATRDLARRLAREAELVPCPKCQWINNELVEGYRRGRLRHAGSWALGMAFFGTVGSFFCAWFIVTGPAADRGLLPYFLFGGPVVCLALAAAILSFQKWSRNRVQPNRNFPLPPELPPGSPPALLLDEQTKELYSANPAVCLLANSHDWIEFQLGRHKLPNKCCECLCDCAPDRNAYQRLIAPGLKLVIPRCRTCARQTAKAYAGHWFAALALSLVALGAVLWLMGLDQVVFWILFGTCSLIMLAFASYYANLRTEPVSFRGADSSRGVIGLKFRNPDYHALVANSRREANQQLY